MVSVDPEDPATSGAAPYVDVDHAAGLSDTSLRGARLGYVAPAPTTPPTPPDPLLEAALAALQAEGATLVPVTVPGSQAPSILVAEFERDLDAYLARLPEEAPMDSLRDTVASTRAGRR